MLLSLDGHHRTADSAGISINFRYIEAMMSLLMDSDDGDITVKLLAIHGQ
jgi:hypothetical protein